jgi:protocatechuate 3,4-dioxygenase beta subunit
MKGSLEPIDRRKALVVLGGMGVAVITAACGSDSTKSSPASTTAAVPGPSSSSAAVSCALAPEVTQGPYFLTDHPQASDLVGDRKGAPLALTLAVVDAACKPISDAKVDVWHCDGAGEYAGVGGAASAGGSGVGAAPAGGGPPGGGPPGGGGAGGSAAATRTNTKTWLQGYQATGADGSVRFDTIYPGWYAGRAVHIHLKVYVGGSAVHTGQLFFPDDLSTTVFKASPYRGDPDTLNSGDSIYRSAGSAALLAPVQAGNGYTAKAQLVVKT